MLALALAACDEPSTRDPSSPPPPLAPAPSSIVRPPAPLDQDPPRLVTVTPPPGTVDAPLALVALDFEDASGLDARATAVMLSSRGLALTEGRDLVRDGHAPDRLVLVLDDPRIDLDLRVVPIDRLGHVGSPIDLQWRGRRDLPGTVDRDPDDPRDDAPIAASPPEILSRMAPIVGPTLVPIVDARDPDGDLVALSLFTSDGAALAELALDPPSDHAELAHDLAGLASGPRAFDVIAVDAEGARTRARLVTIVDADPPSLVLAPLADPVTPAFTLTVDASDASAGLALVEARVVTVLGAPAVLAALTPGALAERVTLALDAPPGPHLVVVTAVDRVGNARVLDLPLTVVPPDERGLDYVVSPPMGASLVAPTTPLVLLLQSPVVGPPEPFAVTITDVPVPGHVDATPDRLTFVPDAPWPSGALVEATISGLRTPSGDPIARERTNFRVRPYAFIDVAADSPSLLAYRGGTGEPNENHGPGGLFADLDADGFPDLVLAAPPRAPLYVWHNVPGPGPSGRAFAPQQIAPASSRGKTGAIGGDIDNDGDLDLFVGVWNGPDRLFRNLHAETGALAFTDVSRDLGVTTSHDGRRPLDLTMTAAFADVDRDGRLDLYVGHHNGHWHSPQLGELPGQRATLFRQLADGTFVDATVAAGVPGWSSPGGLTETPEHRGSSTDAVLFVDLDDDRWPDLVVTNKLRHPDDRQMIYRNLGAAPDGSWRGFEVLTYLIDPALPEGHDLPMGLDANDLDHDGDLDLYITDWASYGTIPGNNVVWRSLFVELGRIDFARLPGATGVYSWGAQIQDFDNDGHLDIHVATNVLEWDLLYRGPDLADVAALADIRQRQNSRGSMTADLDRDGLIDLVVVNLDAPPRVFWNRHPPTAGPNSQHWLTVKLVGDPDLPGPYRSTRDAIGARLVAHVDLDGDGQREAMAREVRSGSSNAVSTSSLELELGLGAATYVDLEVRWPSGRTTWLPSAPIDRIITLVEAP